MANAQNALQFKNIETAIDATIFKHARFYKFFTI
jgi:hypothetical protein